MVGFKLKGGTGVFFWFLTPFFPPCFDALCMLHICFGASLLSWALLIIFFCAHNKICSVIDVLHEDVGQGHLNPRFGVGVGGIVFVIDLFSICS